MMLTGVASWFAPATGTSLILDQLSVGAAGAYSTRKLRNAYAGSAIKVRRSSDNTTQNIGFVSGDLDTTSLSSFVGANSAFIDTWYDQSGNGNDLTQATQGSQLRVVNAGANDTQNGKVCANNTSGNLSVFNTTTPSLSQPYTQNVVINVSSIGSGSRFIADYANGPCWFLDSTHLAIFAGTIADTSSTTSTGAMVLTGIFPAGGGTSSAFQNGSSIGSGLNTNTTSSVGVDIGFLVNGSVGGFIGTTCEAVFFGSALGTSDRQTLEGNQKTYWGTP